MVAVERKTLVMVLLLAAAWRTSPAQQDFTLGQIMSAPYASALTASPIGARFVWVEDAEGRHNLWIGGPGEPAHELTHFTDDDGLDFSGITWSPDGTTLAYARGTETGADGKPANPAHLQPPPVTQVYILSADGKQGPRVAGEGHAPLFSRDGHSIYFVRAGQIWTAATDRAGEAAHQLVFDRGSASQMALSPDGSLLAFVSRRDHDHSFIALYDLRAKTLSFAAPSVGNDTAPAFSRDGKKLAWLRTPFTDAPEFAANRVSANPWSLQVMDVASGKAHAAFVPEANQTGSVLPHLATGEPRLFWDADGRLVFFSETDGWVHLYRLDPDQTGTTPESLTPGNFEVEDATLSSDGTTLLYASNALALPDTRAARMGAGAVDSADTERRHLWSLNLTQSHPKPQQLTYGAGIETHPQIAGPEHAIAALASDERFPMHPVLVGAAGIVKAMHAEAVPAGYPSRQLVSPRQVFFLSADKAYKLHGQLFLPGTVANNSGPHSDDKHPAILFFHGGPHREMLLGYPGMEYYSNAYAMNQYLASRGYIVLSVNYRCGIGYGVEFRQCEHAGADGASEYNDVLGAAAYLRSRPDVDASRIGLWGGSYGGYLTALGLARNSDIFAAGVDFHGVHDWILEDNRADWLRGSNAEKDAIAARAHASSPMADIDHWRSPVLLIHGDDDANVAYEQTPVLADALRARGVHVETLIFPDEVHEFLLHKDWVKAYEAEADFFQRMLADRAGQAPAQAPARMPDQPIK